MTRISTSQQKVDTKKFEDSFENIFGKDKPVVRGSFVQTKDGFVLRGTPTPRDLKSPDFIKPHEDFKSPVDGTIIRSRRQLAEHNKRHGITNAADYSPEFTRKAKERRERNSEREMKRGRIEAIKRSIAIHSPEDQ